MMKRMSVCTLLLLSLILASMFRVQGASERPQAAQAVVYVQKLPARAEQPLEVQKIVVNNQDIEDAHLFAADDFWMKDLVVTVKNVSPRTVQGFNLALQFGPDVNLADIELAKGIGFGIESAGREISLAPGESTDVAITASAFDALKFHVMHMELPQGALKRVTLKVREVYFDINHGWIRGFWVVRDSTNPERFIPDKLHRSKATNSLYQRDVRSNAKEVKNVTFMARRVPSCVVYTGSIRVACTSTGCTDCTALTDTYVDATTTGNKVTLGIAACTRTTPPTNCGCCKSVIWVNFAEECTP